MILGGGLALYTLAVLVLGPALISGRRWPERNPGLGIAAWQAWALSVLISAFGAVAIVTAHAVAEGGLQWLVRLCLHLLSSPRTLVVSTGIAVLGVLVTAVMLFRLAMAALLLASRSRRQRRRHQAGLALVARPLHGTTVLIEHSTPLAYCLPGRRCQVVISTGATSQLEPAELAAVLAHEGAHLSGRHHWILFAASTLAQAFPLRRLRAAHDELAVLVEMLADDTATRRHGAAELAGALATLATGSVQLPQPALGAAQLAAARRFDRLTAARPAMPRQVRFAGWTVLVLAIAVPISATSVAVASMNAGPAVLCPTPITVARTTSSSNSLF